MTAADDVEIEWQFDALDLRPVERWLAALPEYAGTVFNHPSISTVARPPRRLFDTYLDTDDWRFGRAGYVLRVRRRGRDEEATIKDNRPADQGGLRTRLEVSEPLGAGGVSALDDKGPVGRRVKALAGKRATRDLLEVRTRRRPYVLRIDGVDVAEVALDDTVIAAAGERPVHLRRVEVEVVGGRVSELRPIVAHLQQTCGLRPATLSKFEAGLLALGIEVPAQPDLGPIDVTRDSSLGDVAFAVLRRHTNVLLAKEPGTRVGDDIEDLHEMRVATRRLRAAIEVFSDVLPSRSQSLRSELGWAATVLGEVRDLDVQLERMTETEEWTAGWAAWDLDASSLEELRSLLETRREVARLRLLTALDSRRWDRLVTGLQAMLVRGPNRRLSVVREPALLALPELVDIRHRAAVRTARKAQRSGEAEDFHRLRIRCKRLRYSLEFTSGVYGGRTERFTKRLAALQDKLGLMQDAEVAMHRLREMVASEVNAGSDHTEPGLPAATVFMMGAVAERYRVESEVLLAGMPDRVAVLDDRRWRALASLMVQRREDALASAAAARLAEITQRKVPDVVPETVALPTDGPEAPREESDEQVTSLPVPPAEEPTVAGWSTPVWTVLTSSQSDADGDSEDDVDISPVGKSEAEASAERWPLRRVGPDLRRP